MKMMRDIGLLYRRGLIHTLRIPVWVVVGISTPLLYLALFTPLLENLAGAPGFPPTDVLDLFLPGILALMAFGSGTGAGFAIIFEIQAGFTERLQVSPASRFALLMGPVLSSLTWTYVFSIMIVVVAIPFGYHLHLAGMLVSLVLLGLLLMVFASFSIALALITREISSLAAIMNGINLPILLLSGVLLPLSLAPEWMRVIAHLNPMYYVVEANRILATGKINDAVVIEAFLIMVPSTIIVMAWATRVYRRAVS
ncbi:MAG: ABC transporter permease [Actinobacteria bacterium]|nr:ABC transporter permease [Actinomycetota bacterium]